jgi:hypothetical protein
MDLVGTKDCCEVRTQEVPLLKKLQESRAKLQKQIDEHDEAIKALEANPEFEKMLNVLGKVSRIY